MTLFALGYEPKPRLCFRRQSGLSSGSDHLRVPWKVRRAGMALLLHALYSIRLRLYIECGHGSQVPKRLRDRSSEEPSGLDSDLHGRYLHGIAPCQSVQSVGHSLDTESHLYSSLLPCLWSLRDSRATCGVGVGRSQWKSPHEESDCCMIGK